MKSFLLNGFNMAGNRRAFDGMHVFVSAAGLLPILQTGTGPESSANGIPTFANPEFPGINDGPLTIGEIIAKVEARGEVPPKMLLINSTTDYYSLRASLGALATPARLLEAAPTLPAQRGRVGRPSLLPR